jgi:hypothetical protein
MSPRTFSASFDEKNRGKKAITRQALVGLSLDKDVKFKVGDDDNNFLMFTYAYRMVSRVVRFRAVQPGKKCKHLSNFSQ